MSKKQKELCERKKDNEKIKFCSQCKTELFAEPAGSEDDPATHW